MISATDEQMVGMTEWLNSQGYDFDMRDGLWMEDCVNSEHKWRDIFDMLASWEVRQAPTASPNTASLAIAAREAVDCWKSADKVNFADFAIRMNRLEAELLQQA